MYLLARLRPRLRPRLLLASQRLLSFAFANRRSTFAILSCVWAFSSLRLRRIAAFCVCALAFALRVRGMARTESAFAETAFAIAAFLRLRLAAR